MRAMNYSHLRSHMKTTFDQVTDEFDTVTVTRKDGKNIVIMSEGTYNNLMETVFVMSNKANYDWLMESKRQLEKGQAKAHPLSTESKKR
jgi:antitoxin YefM